MIIFDTETTGLLQPDATPLAAQPHIIELGVLKVRDEDLSEVDAYSALVRPPAGVTLDAKITEITGLRMEDFRDARPFSAHYAELVRLFLGETVLVAHNCPFDVGMLTNELRRMNAVTRFPWPPTHACTVERTRDIRGHRLKLTELHEHYFGTVPPQSHRALDDCQLLLGVVRRMREENRL